MNHDKWKFIEAGPETDALVASLLGRDDLTGLSTDMAVAWPINELCARQAGYKNDGFEWRGPIFKHDSTYLTSEGYPLGTEGWYVVLEACGARIFVCADTPALAVARAVIQLHDGLQSVLRILSEPLSKDRRYWREKVVKGLFPDIDAAFAVLEAAKDGKVL